MDLHRFSWISMDLKGSGSRMSKAACAGGLDPLYIKISHSGALDLEAWCPDAWMLEGLEWIGGGDGGDGILGRGDWKKSPHARASGVRRISHVPNIGCLVLGSRRQAPGSRLPDCELTGLPGLCVTSLRAIQAFAPLDLAPLDLVDDNSHWSPASWHQVPWSRTAGTRYQVPSKWWQARLTRNLTWCQVP